MERSCSKNTITVHGAEVMELSGKESQGLEVVQNKAARLGLGAGKYAPIETLKGRNGMEYAWRKDIKRQNRI